MILYIFLILQILKNLKKIRKLMRSFSSFPSCNLFFSYYKKNMPQLGIEPRTQGFSVPCSTNWAIAAYSIWILNLIVKFKTVGNKIFFGVNGCKYSIATFFIILAEFFQSRTFFIVRSEQRIMLRYGLPTVVFSQLLQACFPCLLKICLQDQMQGLNAAFHDLLAWQRFLLCCLVQ